MLAAADWLAARPEVEAARIGGLGLSVGGEVMMTAAARSPAIAAVVSEGAGERSIREAATDAGPARWPSLPTQAVLTGAVALFSGGGPPPGLADLAGRIAPRPLPLVYGERGQEGERRLNPLYADAAGDTATLWEVPGAAHIGGLEARPAEYERRVVGFFDAHL